MANHSNHSRGKMKAAVIRERGKFAIEQVDIPKPEAKQVRIKVEACGVCHSDSFAIEGLWPGLKYPLTPGHEVVGVIDELGPDTFPWKQGERVGVGWTGYYCGYCSACRRGDLTLCENAKVTGLSFNGGYAEYMVAPVTGLARVPTGLVSAEAAPLLCAGVTTFNSLRHSGAGPGDVVAVLGVGGLGHLAVQFANKIGAYTVAISRSMKSEHEARELGARAYIATDSMDPVVELKKLGGAKVIIATAPSSKLMSSLIGGLGDNGQFMVIAATDEPIQFSGIELLSKKRSIKGWSSGVASDSEDTMRFSEQNRVRAMIEKFPLEKAEEAYHKMMDGKVKYRAVLIP